MAKNEMIERSSRFKECKNQIKALVAAAENGIKKNDLSRLFMEKYRTRIPSGMFQYSSAVEFVVDTMSDIVLLKRNTSGEDVLVYRQRFGAAVAACTAATAASSTSAATSPNAAAAVGASGRLPGGESRSMNHSFNCGNQIKTESSQILVTIPGVRQVQVVDYNMNIEHVPAVAAAPSTCASVSKIFTVETKKTALSVIKERIQSMLAAFPNGLWADSLASFYQCHYERPLPVDVQIIISDHDLFDAELFTPSTGPRRLIVYPKIKSNEQERKINPQAVGTFCKYQGVNANRGDSGIDSIGNAGSMDTSTDSFVQHDLEPDQLELPADNVQIKVFVSHVRSVSDICIQIKGSAYSDNLLELDKILGELEPYNLKEIVPGSMCYYYKIGGQSIGGCHFMRVRVIEKAADDQVVVEFVDYGDVIPVPQSDLYYLPAVYNRLPYQAVHCSLTESETLIRSCSNEEWREYIENVLADEILGKVFVARIDSRLPVVSVTLWSEDCKISINQKILQQINHTIVF